MPRPVPPIGRRAALRLLALLAAPLAPFAVPLLPALAGRKWCRIDPVFAVDGQTAHVRVAAQVRNMREARALATGPTRVVLRVPAGVDAAHLASSNGFGHGFDACVEESDALVATDGALPVEVLVEVPMERVVRVSAEFAPSGRGRLVGGRGEGWANATLLFAAPRSGDTGLPEDHGGDDPDPGQDQDDAPGGQGKPGGPAKPGGPGKPAAPGRGPKPRA